MLSLYSIKYVILVQYLYRLQSV